MMAKPIRALELHYPMIQFIIIRYDALLQNRTGSSPGHKPLNRKHSYKGLVRRSRSISLYCDSPNAYLRMFS